MLESTDGGYTLIPMIQNPKLLSLVQTLFYGFFTVATPLFITALGAGGALNGYFSPAVTIALLWVLNAVDNQMSKGTTGNFFGSIA